MYRKNPNQFGLFVIVNILTVDKCHFVYYMVASKNSKNLFANIFARLTAWNAFNCDNKLPINRSNAQISRKTFQNFHKQNVK